MSTSLSQHRCAIFLLAAALASCGHAQSVELPPSAVVGQPLPGSESALFLRVQVTDTTGSFNGFARVVLEGPMEGRPEQFELGAGRADPTAVASTLAAPPAHLSEVVAARAQPGTYRLVAIVVGAGASRSGGQLVVRVSTVSLPRELVVPPGRLVYLGVFDATLSRAGTGLLTQVRHQVSAATLLADLTALQRAHRAYLRPFLARAPDVFAPRLKPLARAVPPSKRPVCTPRNAGECAMACDKGDGRCCSDLGYLYERGQGVPKDAARAVGLYARGCDRGNSLGCKNLGVMYLAGIGVEQNAARAVLYFRRSCDMGDPRGCSSLGRAYADGSGLPVDAIRGLQLLLSACTAGVAGACNDAGWILGRRRGVAADPARAAQLFHRACTLGSANGCSGYGWALATGAGVEKDRPRGLEYLQRGCRAGNVWGCDRQRALCNEGDGAACFALANRYARGEGVAKDPAQAAALTRRGCERGHAPACGEGATEPRPAAPSAPLAVVADPWREACEAHAAYEKVRWTVSLSEKVVGGRVTSRGRRTLALERDPLLALVQRVRAQTEPSLAAIQRRLVAAIKAAPVHKDPVPRHMGGGADMVVSDVLKVQLARFWKEVAGRAARHGAACAVSPECPPGSPIIDGKCAAR